MALSSDIANPEDFTPQAQVEQDAKLLVKFYLKSRQDKAKSLQEGRPIFTEREYIEIRIPGSRDAIARPAGAAAVQRFPRHYQMFKDRIDVPLEGTPLTEWPSIGRTTVEELSFLNIKTVEALASVADAHMAKFKGLSLLKRKAQDWIDLAESDAPLEQLHEQLTIRDAKLASQDELLAKMGDAIKGLEARLSALTGTQAAAAPVSEPSLMSALDIPAEPPPVITKRRLRRKPKTD